LYGRAAKVAALVPDEKGADVARLTSASISIVQQRKELKRKVSLVRRGMMTSIEKEEQLGGIGGPLSDNQLFFHRNF